MEPSQSQIFRVEQIPSGISTQALLSYFSDIDRPDIQIKSLTPSAAQEYASLVATVAVSFPDGEFRYPELRDESSCITIDDDFEGLTPLYAPEGDSHDIDVIAVSDLFEHPFYSWAATAEQAWLRDALPHDLPRSRVYLYGHDVELQSEKGLLEACAETFLRRLATITKGRNRPLVLLGYRTGCLVIEKATTMALATGGNTFLQNLATVIFLDGTHIGLPNHFFDLLPEGKSKNVIAGELREGSDTLQALDASFARAIRNTRIVQCSQYSSAGIESYGNWTPCRTISSNEAIEQLQPQSRQYRRLLEEIKLGLGIPSAQSPSREKFINFSKPVRSKMSSSPRPEIHRRDSIISPESSPKATEHKFAMADPEYQNYVAFYSNKPLPKPPNRKSSSTLPASVLQRLANAVTAEVPQERKMSISVLQEPKGDVVETTSILDSPITTPQSITTPLSQTVSISAFPFPPSTPSVQAATTPRPTTSTFSDSLSPLDAAPLSSTSPRPRRASSSTQSIRPTFSRSSTLDSVLSRLRGTPRSPLSDDSVSTPGSPPTTSTLYTAITTSHIPTVSSLLFQPPASFNINAPLDPLGNTALHLVCASGNRAILALLLAPTKRAPKLKLNVRNTARQTPLHVAAANGHSEVVRTLCNPSSGIDLHAVDREGNTPLHVAAIRGQMEAVRVLCVMGARAREKRADGRTAGEVAKSIEVRRYLEGRERADTVVSWPGLF